MQVGALRLLNSPLEQSSLPRRIQLYCQARGVVLVGELYQLPFDRETKTRETLVRFLQQNRLPPMVPAALMDWRPDYLDDPAIRKLWDRPVGDLFLDSPHLPYDEGRPYWMQRSVDRWLWSHRRGCHYVAQALQYAQQSMYYLKDLQVAIRRRRWPLHAAMLVRDWKAPEAIPEEWPKYLETVGVERSYQPSMLASPAFTARLTTEDLRRFSKLAALLGSVEELNFSVRSDCMVKALNIKTAWELVQYPLHQLLKARNFGQKSLTEMRKKLEVHGLTLGMSEHDLVQYITNVIQAEPPEQ